MSEEKKSQVTPDSNIIAAIGYVWLLFLIPLLLKRNNEYCQFHAKQGLVLFICSLIIMVLGAIPVIGWLIIMPIGWILIAIMSLLGIINALSGKKWALPYLGKFAKKINL